MANITHILKAFNVFLNGEILQGNISEVHIPTIEWNTQTIVPNTFGELEFPTTLKKMIAAIKVRGYVPSVSGSFDGVLGIPNTRLEIRAAIEDFNANTLQAKWEYTGLAKQLETAPLRPGELGELTLAVNAHWWRHSVEGQEVLFGDILNNILRVKGWDRMADIRAALEGEIFGALVGVVDRFAGARGTQAFNFIRDVI